MEYVQDNPAHTTNVVRLVVGAVLLFSGFNKVTDVTGFSQILRQFRVVPSALTTGFAIFLSVLEMVFGGWLVIGERALAMVAAVATGLLLVFAIVVAIPLLHGRCLECGCFGRLGRGKATWATVVRSSVFAGLAAMTAATVDTNAPGWSTGGTALVVVITLVVGATLIAEALSVFHLGHSLRRPKLARGGRSAGSRAPDPFGSVIARR